MKWHWKTNANQANPLSKYTRRKVLSREEQLEYQVELLKRELMKKGAEVTRLKKSIELEGGDIEKVIQQIYSLIQCRNQPVIQWLSCAGCTRYLVLVTTKWLGRSSGQTVMKESRQPWMTLYGIFIRIIHPWAIG